MTSDQLVNTQNIKGNAPFILAIHREENLVDLKFWRLAAFLFCHGSIELTCLLYLWSLSILAFFGLLTQSRQLLCLLGTAIHHNSIIHSE